MSNQQNPINLNTPVTKIMAIGRLTAKGMDISTRLPVMTREVPATVELYLAGKIEQWWVMPDASGVVFLLNVNDPALAHTLLDALPLGVAGMMEFELIPLGPLTPLRFLLQAV